uniref:Glucagon / GIP / secretin / VIP family domain-containing protein n=1 Tax=Strigops habroptila TaxID=2489341 RepID=A0A672UU33_STRHB
MQVVRWLNLCGLLLAVLIPTGWMLWARCFGQDAWNLASNIKRHSEGTFTSDFTRYLDKMKAKDFVHWLINTKRFRYN